MFKRSSSLSTALHALLFGVLLLTVAWVYAHGLRGVPLLDDSINLAKLSDIEEPTQLDQIARFTFSGAAGGTGRPIAMASFAVQYHSWPSAISDFRYVNLLIHLLNGCLVFWLAIEIGRARNIPPVRAVTLGLIATALWLLHPLQVSTVLYTVQRMTELAAMFSLAALVAYLKARSSAMQASAVRGYIGMSVALMLGTISAALSKENGILLPLLLLTLELTLLNDTTRPPYWRWWAAVFIGLPIVAFGGWLISHFDVMVVNTYRVRPFTLTERLLTEARVLWDYIGKFCLPAGQLFGVFQDDYVISRSLTAPYTTFFAAAAWIAVLGSAIFLRRSAPYFTFAVFWFLGAHILESSFIPLELYFEHRNYLPLVGLCFAAAAGMTYVYELPQARRLRPVFIGGCAIVLLIVTSTTYQEAKVWGMPLQQAAIWEKQHPHSSRAKEWMGTMLAKTGHGAEAAAHFTQMIEDSPHDASGYAYALHLHCYYADLPAFNQSAAAERLSIAEYSIGAIGALDAILSAKENGECASVRSGDLMSLIDALLDNPHYGSRHSNLYFMKGRLIAVGGDFSNALLALNEAFKREPRVETALLQAAWSAQLGRWGDANRHLANARARNRGHNWAMKTLNEKQITDLKQLISDIQSRDNKAH